jgi:hypothetical protein
MSEMVVTPSLAAKGMSGELRHGYHVAARFGAWTLNVERGSASSIVSVSALEPDGFWFDQYPQSLKLQVGTRLWVWRVAERLNETQYRVSGDPEVM